VSEELRRSVDELVRWAEALRTLAYAPGSVGRPMLRLLGVRPYVFECNAQRWPDGLFHLVGRGYQEFTGVIFNEEQLARTGVTAWDRSRWCRVKMAHAQTLMDDVFMNIATKKAMHQLGGILYEIAREFR
jgi:hypothetical protein